MVKKYIDCEALIDALMSYSWHDENDFSIDDADEKRKYIEGWLPNIPAADVTEVRHGRWIADKEDVEWGNYFIRYRCSECKERPHFSKDRYTFIRSPYCPNCGAKMDKEAEDD